MIEYAKAIGASDEVIMWVNTTLEAHYKKHGKDIAESEHILDYLVSDSAPRRLRKMSYEQAKAGAEKWTKANQKRGRDIVDGPGDIETIHNFSGGSKIVKLLTKRAFEREGFFMAHCLGGYDPEGKIIYSYRDRNNDPHATFEVSANEGEIFQIKGKGNGPIHPKYIEPILAFLEAIGQRPRPSEMSNLGYYEVNDSVEEVLNMFVDPQGKGPEYHVLYGVKYIAA